MEPLACSNQPLGLVGNDPVAQTSWKPGVGELSKTVKLGHGDELTFSAVPTNDEDDTLINEDLDGGEGTTLNQVNSSLPEGRRLGTPHSFHISRYKGGDFVDSKTTSGVGNAPRIVSHATKALTSLLENHKPMHVEMYEDRPSSQQLLEHMIHKHRGKVPYSAFYDSHPQQNGTEAKTYYLIHQDAIAHPDYQNAIKERKLTKIY